MQYDAPASGTSPSRTSQPGCGWDHGAAMLGWSCTTMFICPEWDRAGFQCQLGMKMQFLANLSQSQAIKSRQESYAIYFWKKCSIYLAWLHDCQYPLWIKHTDKLVACKGKLWVLASGGHYCKGFCCSGNFWNSFRVLGGAHWLPSTLQEFWLLTVLASGAFQS